MNADSEVRVEDPVMAIGSWASNAELIADVARLGYLRKEWATLDPTFGEGTWWRSWRPDSLTASDIVEAKSPFGSSVDFTALPFGDRSFDAVVFDPRYKMNGRPSEPDERYGADVPASWQDVMDLCRRGIIECARVLGDGFLLVKCQDAVCSGKVRWQTIDFTETAERSGLGLVDRFEFLSYRPQPNGVRQKTARRSSSHLLVFKRGWTWRAQ
jgi:hypothetical protein